MYHTFFSTKIGVALYRRVWNLNLSRQDNKMSWMLFQDAATYLFFFFLSTLQTIHTAKTKIRQNKLPIWASHVLCSSLQRQPWRPVSFSFLPYSFPPFSSRWPWTQQIAEDGHELRMCAPPPPEHWHYTRALRCLVLCHAGGLAFLTLTDKHWGTWER